MVEIEKDAKKPFEVMTIIKKYKRRISDITFECVTYIVSIIYDSKALPSFYSRNIVIGCKSLIKKITQPLARLQKQNAWQNLLCITATFKVRLLKALIN